MTRLHALQKPTWGQLACALSCVGVLMNGCAGTSSPSQTTVGASTGPQLYAANVASARQAQAEGHLREAMWRWRVAEAVAPGRKEAAQQAAQAQAQLITAADMAEQEGDSAARAGRETEARAAYARALELDPRRAKARAFLQALEARAVDADMSRHSGSAPPTRESRSSAKAKKSRVKSS